MLFLKDTKQTRESSTGDNNKSNKHEKAGKPLPLVINIPNLENRLLRTDKKPNVADI